MIKIVDFRVNCLPFSNSALSLIKLVAYLSIEEDYKNKNREILERFLTDLVDFYIPDVAVYTWFLEFLLKFLPNLYSDGAQYSCMSGVWDNIIHALDQINRHSPFEVDFFKHFLEISGIFL